MSKCHHYQKHCAITAVIALQHSWQAELSSSWVYLFTIWLWTHFQAGHSCTKTVCVPHYKDIWFSMKKNLNYVVFFLHPLLPSKKKCKGDCMKANKNNSDCPVVSDAKSDSHRATAPAEPAVNEWVCVWWGKREGKANFDIVLVTLCSFFKQPPATAVESDHWTWQKMLRILLKYQDVTTSQIKSTPSADIHRF